MRCIDGDKETKTKEKMMAILTWLGKNAGLMLGIVEIFVMAIVDTITQTLKVIAGIVNVLEPSRAKDILVKWAEKLEGASAWIVAGFDAIKKFLYNIGLPPTK